MHEKNSENIFNIIEGIGRVFDLLKISDMEYGYNYTDFLNNFENLGGRE